MALRTGSGEKTNQEFLVRFLPKINHVYLHKYLCISPPEQGCELKTKQRYGFLLIFLQEHCHINIE